MTKEQMYDEQFSPLMTELIRLSKLHDIPMVASFQLNDHRTGSEEENPGFLCTTCILPVDSHERLKEAHLALRNIPQFAAFAITTSKKEGA